MFTIILETYTGFQQVKEKAPKRSKIKISRECELFFR